MPYVDAEYYLTTYYGNPVTPATDFPKYEARAEEVIDALTRYRVQQQGLENLPSNLQTLVKNAVCAQISYFVEEGISTAISGQSTAGFTVGKVSVSGKDSKGSGASSIVAPAAIMLLEQTGLMQAAVSVFDNGWGWF